MGRAEDLFARIESEGMEFVEALIRDQATEELFLEFKRSANDGDDVRLHERDRTNLRKAICGFANSEGGVIVWGIDCQKKSDAGDVAASLKPISTPTRYVSLIEGAVSGCTVPPVTGVRTIAIRGEETQGLVATYVPKSSHAPHQLAGEGKYLIRAGSDFVPAPHGVVAGLFGTPPHPVVYPNYVVGPARVIDGVVAASVTIMLVNDGRVVAEDLFVSLLFPSIPNAGECLIIEPKVSWPSTSSVGVDRSFISQRETRLPPGAFVSVVTIHLRLNQNPTSDFHCKLTTGCARAIPHSEEWHVRKNDLQALITAALDSTTDMTAINNMLFGINSEH